MLEVDRNAFKEQMAALSVTFPIGQPEGTKNKKIAFEAYFEALGGFAIGEVIHGVSWMIQNREERFWPTPAEIKKAIQQVCSTRSPKQAWAEAVRIAATVSDYEAQPKHPDRVAQQVVRTLGGWQAIWGCNADTLQWMEKRFYEQYDELAQSPEKVALLEAPPPQKRIADVIECTFKPVQERRLGLREHIEQSLKLKPVVELKRPGVQRNQADTGPNLEDKTPHAAITNTVEELRRQALILKGENGDESEQAGLPVPVEE